MTTTRTYTPKPITTSQEFGFMTSTDSNYQTDRLIELKQEFLDSGDLLEALSELSTGKETAKEIYKLSQAWYDESRNGFDKTKMLEIGIQAFAKISAIMEVYAERVALEAFDNEHKGDGDQGYDRDEIEFRQAA